MKKKIPLSIEESINLRSEIIKQEESFERITKEKDNRIIEQTSEIKKLESEKLELEKSVSDLRKEVESQKNRIDNIINGDDFSKVFKKVSVYEIENKERWKFQIYGKNELGLSRDDLLKEYKLYPIKNRGSEHFVILMYPKHKRNNEGYEIKLIELNRTSEIHEFEGEEMSITIIDGKIKNCNKSKITIHELL